MTRAASLVLTVLIAALAGCGGGSSGSSSSTPPASAPASTSSAPAAAGGGHSLQVAADPSGQLRYTKTSLAAKAGKVSIDFTNGSALGHNLTIQRGTSGPNLGATPTFTGGSKVLTLDLKPGTYTFYCSVPGHRQAGMHGTLVVK
jgi:plastocyanin